MVYASKVAHDLELAEGYGWSGFENAKFDWKAFIAKKDVEIARLSGIYVTNLKNAGAELLHGRAVLKDAHTIEITGQDARTVTADKILIAVGGWPSLPDDVPGCEHAISSNEAFHLPQLPKSIVVVGGGYIAVEFAGIFAGMGSQVTLAYRGPNILRGFDDDIRAHVAEEMTKRGVKVVLSTQHERIEKAEDGFISHLTDGLAVHSEQVMFATGRKPKVDGLGLETAGVKLNDKGAIEVDEFSRTSVENIWAIGDVTDRMNLTPVAIREAIAFVDTAFNNKPSSFGHKDVPTAVFSQPPVGTVGMTEAEARHACRRVDIYKTRFRPMESGFAGADERMLMKLVVNAETDQVLGCHIVGEDSAEMIQLAGIAIKMGVTKAQWDDVCAVHPTAAEELVTMRSRWVPPELAAAE
jgi:glutathione reductase (NADPH)